MEQLMGQSSARHKVAHQDEQRNDRQGVGKTGFLNHLSCAGQSRHPTACEADADNAYQTHGKSQGHAQQRQAKYGNKANECFGHRTPPSDSSSSRKGLKTNTR